LGNGAGTGSHSVDPAGSGDPASADAVLAALDPEQREVAQALLGPVCVLAGAGTGKTRAITHRIAYGVRTGTYVPQHVLAVTFTARAAGEMRDRLRRLGADGVQARTFHSAALRQLRYFWPDVVGGEQPRIVETKAPLVAEAAHRAGASTDTALVRDLAAEIEWAKVSRLSPDAYLEVAPATGRAVESMPAPHVARVYAAYDEIKRGRGLFDFEDVLLFVVAMLEDSPRVAAVVRGQYRHLVVDEYQDVNPLQQSLLDLWLGDRQEICVVGDPSQTIYSFAGACQDYLLDFSHRYPGAQVVQLERNYRSTAPILTLANRVLASAPTSQAAPRLSLRSQIGDGPTPTVTTHPDESTEADEVAAAITRLLDGGTPAREIAVLYRINAQAVEYERALGDAKIPYVIRGGERFFERAEVRRAVTLLRGAARAAAGPPADADAGDRPALGEMVREVLGNAGWTPTPPAGTGAVRSRWESLAALAQLADDLAESNPAANLSEFVGHVDARAAIQHAPVAEGVTLSTLHAAKGLEWDAVFVVGLTDGSVPLVHATTQEEIEEERRLLYVGLTRAKRHLALSWARARTATSRAPREPSRFLDGITFSRSVDARTASGRASSPRARTRKTPLCRVCGRPLATGADRKLGRCESCPSNVDDALYDRLRAWRSALAKELSLPAYCVFTDATLLAIAERSPQTTRDLAALPGVGKIKLERYGRAVIEVCCGGTGEDRTSS
jgi:DNA helicase-2/ATP-dependent DNA helicase PcrA